MEPTEFANMRNFFWAAVSTVKQGANIDRLANDRALGKLMDDIFRLGMREACARMMDKLRNQMETNSEENERQEDA